MSGTAAQRWRELQQGRGIPPEILARAEESPWVHGTKDFEAPDEPVDTPSRHSALELLRDGGSVLDVGCGGGAASLVLAGRVQHITGVDHQTDMLDAFEEAARARGIDHDTVLGEWPGVAAAAGVADVVVCHHVLHNVVELAPFLDALSAAGRRGVVVEMFEHHPMAWLDPLWARFHGLRRPPSATTDDAVAVLAELGVRADVARWARENPPRQDAAWITRRLCLPGERVAEVEAALGEIPARPRMAATLVWRL